MRRIEKGSAPVELERAKEHGKQRWSAFRAKSRVVEALAGYQKWLCAYCEIRVDDPLVGSHVEHVMPQKAYPELSLDWNNMVLSCVHSMKIEEVRTRGGLSCGHSQRKQKWDGGDPRFISPLESGCERFFAYEASTGEVAPSDQLAPDEQVRAEYTIALLALNCSRLCRERRTMLQEGYTVVRELIESDQPLEYFLDLEFSEIGGKVCSFPSARTQHFWPFRFL